MATILVHFTSSPYASGAIGEGLDFAISATNYGHQVIALFSDDAVWMWQSEQHTPDGIKSVSKRLKALPLFDVEKLYVCESSLRLRAVNADHNRFEQVTGAQIAAFFEHAEHVVTF